MITEYNDILTADELARYLRLSKNTVYPLLKNGTVKSIRVGRRYLIPKKFVIDFTSSEEYNSGVMVGEANLSERSSK